MESKNSLLLTNRNLFSVGVRLVKFAWVIEILAVTIGFLISIIVAYSVYDELNRHEGAGSFGDYANILVAGLPFVLVAVVEAAKIPTATAMMYARHIRWRILLFTGLIMLAFITFETMSNGFERNFAGLNLSIDEQKNESLLLENQIKDLERRKREINTIDPDHVDNQYNKTVEKANENYYRALQVERQHINKQLQNLKDDYEPAYKAQIRELEAKKNEIYESWDEERVALQKRLRSLLNQNVSGASSDKEKLQKEVDDLKAEMKQKLAEASFLTKASVEEKYRKLIKEKEQRLYKLADFAAGSSALTQQTQTEQQLQEQLQILGKNFQKRIDMVQKRIDELENELNERRRHDEEMRKKYQKEFKSYSRQVANNKQSIINRMEQVKKQKLNEYQSIQEQVKAIDAQIFEIKKKQTVIAHKINRLVNSNQIYRMAAYIDDKENAIEVPKKTVGLVALVWFSSLAFICATTGIFLAVSGIYLQKTYAEKEQEDQEAEEAKLAEQAAAESQAQVQVQEQPTTEVEPPQPAPSAEVDETVSPESTQTENQSR